MMRRMKRKRDENTTIFDSLPQDLIVEIVARLASDSLDPISDLHNLRMTCKMFRTASEAKLVGQHLSVEKLRCMRRWNDELYFSILRCCAAAGNLEACFILGLENAFNLGRMSLGLYYLSKAIVGGGHSGATYLRGILLFGVHQTRQAGIEILKKIGGGADNSEGSTKIRDSYVEQCLRMILDPVWNDTWRYPQRQGERCTNPRCGNIEGWEQRRSFCSELCKWNFEYLLLRSYMW